MDPELLANAGTTRPQRKVRFAPKGPPKREQKPVVPKPEKVEPVETEESQAEELRRLFNEAAVKVKSKTEKKVSHTKVAFGYGGATSLRSYGSKGGINKPDGSASADGSAFLGKPEKEYKEPWNYYSYYPVTLPMRRPYSGNPEHLDQEEFGESSENRPYDEASKKPAVELGLADENLEGSMFFIQLPRNLPIPKQPVNATGEEQKPTAKGPSKKTSGLNDLPAGFMGKMLVYKSGAVKMKLGENIYDISAGMDGIFAQDVVAVNTEEKICCNVGEVGKRMIVTPDVDALLNSMSDL